jgi:uncharacterized repeat protein (TIGR02543 family)
MKRNQKLLSVVTVLALLLALFPAEVTPAQADGNWTEVDTWEKLETAFLNARGGSACIRLTADVKPKNPQQSSPLTITDGSVDLDLNGYTINRGLQAGEQENGCVIKASGARLTVGDSSGGDGTITGGNTEGDGGGIYAESTTLTLDGVTISANNASHAGGGVYICDYSTLVMSGGSISQNSAQYGGGVHVDGPAGQFQMSGGSISNNSAEIGCGVYMLHGMLDMTGGSVVGNQNPMTAEDALRGGVVVSSIQGSSFTVSGKVTITDNAGGNVLLVDTTEEIPFRIGGQEEQSAVLDSTSRIGVSRYVVSQPDPDDNPYLLLPRYPVGGYVTSALAGRFSLDSIVSDLDGYTVQLETEGDYTGEAMLVAKDYSITYDLNGGTITAAAANPTTYTRDTESFTLLIPAKTGYTFAGWTGTGLSAATVTVLIPRGSTGNRSYTATWLKNTDNDVRVTGISVEDYNLNALPIGDCWKATAIVDPKNATNPGVLWTSSNPSVVIVDENGLIRAVGTGTATVTVTTVDGGKQKTGEITVKNADEITSSCVQMDRTTAKLAVGETLRLYANSTPNALSVRWVSNNTSVLTVDENGLVTAVSPGAATVDAYVTLPGLEFEQSAPCRVQVTEATPQSIRLDGTAADNVIEVDVRNDDAQLSATLVGAWYDADGRLLGVAVQTVTVEGRTTSFFDLTRPAGASDAASCSVFLLGSGFEPLCASKSASRQGEP